MPMDLLSIILYVVIIGVPLLAQLKITSSYKKYKQVENTKNISGFEVARKVLDANGLQDIYVVEVDGDLTDHYDPTRKTVRLSRDIFNGTSIASMSVAAHECGHAIQDKVGYKPMRIRSMLVPLVNISSKLSWAIIMIGLASQLFKLFLVGIALISIGLLFQLITLPVEFDASRRAKIELEKLKLVNTKEASGVKNMLGSAAMTYVASVLTAILEIVRLFLMYTREKR